MRWLKLDLKRAPNVRKEVDDAIRAYSDAIRSGDKQAIDKLRMAFEARIEQVRARAEGGGDGAGFGGERARARSALSSSSRSRATPPHNLAARRILPAQ